MNHDLWDLRFLGMARHVAQWSKDPSTKVGAVVAAGKRIVSLGFNGFPAGIEDSPARLNNRDLKYTLTVHAEENAILFAQQPLGSATLYVWPFMPCASCARIVVQVGIKRVVAPHVHAERWMDSFAGASRLFQEAGVALDLVPWNEG